MVVVAESGDDENSLVEILGHVLNARVVTRGESCRFASKSFKYLSVLWSTHSPAIQLPERWLNLTFTDACRETE